MSQQGNNSSTVTESSVSGMPLSERPVVVAEDNTVISERDRVQATTQEFTLSESAIATRRRLFPSTDDETGQEAGIRIGQFEIRERIGSGGMGVVFRATDLELSRDVALKILHPATTHDPSLIARFRNEARACAQLNHDNIARVYLSGCVDGLFFIAYELAAGITIRDLIQQRGKLSAEEAVNYAIQVTLALNHLNAEGVVHRDIKPSNIMLTERGRVKVVDLGLARREVADSIGDLTVAGTTLGTFDYIAPEQARDPRIADIRSDIYSLGCTVYQMLTGQPPYPEGTALQKLLDHQGKSPPDPRSLNSAIPIPLAAVMRKMMASDPTLRYQAPALLLSDLIQIAATMGLRSVPADGIVWKKTDGISQRSPMGAAWLFGSVLVICLTALALNWTNDGPDRSAFLADSTDHPGDLMTPEQFLVDNAGNSVEPQDAATGDDSAAADPPSTVSNEPSASANSELANDQGTHGSQSSQLPSVAASIPFPMPIPTTNFQWPIAATVPMDPDAAASSMTIAAMHSEGRFALQSPDGTQQSFNTLQAAVADSRSGDVILLQYNGHPADIPAQPPVRIPGMNLIIRAATGFQPTLEFVATSEPSGMPAAMFSIRNSGSLTIRDVNIRFVTTADTVTDSIAVFRSDAANRIQLDGVTVDIVNATRQVVNVFELTDPATSSDPATPLAENEITLINSMIRGVTNVFCIESQQRASIRMANCCCAIQGAVFLNLGNASMLQPSGLIDVRLEHVTTLVQGELILMKDSDELTGNGAQRVLPSMVIRSEACVFSGLGNNPRLVVSEGNSHLEDLEGLLTWTGFTNLYHGISVFWQIDTAAFDYSSRRLDFSEWKQGWLARLDCEENNAAMISNDVWLSDRWRSPGASIEPATFDVAAFSLKQQRFGTTTDTLSLARDGKMPGVDTSMLRSTFESVTENTPADATEARDAIAADTSQE
jgi:eukaryotic-like serine/threonine-protein kinase